VGYKAMLHQAGNYFGGPLYSKTTKPDTWHSLVWKGLKATDFTRHGGTGALNPDFSASGKPIRFGIGTTNGTGKNKCWVNTCGRVDDWKVTARRCPSRLPGDCWSACGFGHDSRFPPWSRLK